MLTLLLQGAFFFLLQSEEGDLFKVTIDHEEEEVQSVKIKYFDTVPVASSLAILKSGFLFVASDFGNPRLYQFEKLGDDDTETEFSSTDYPNFGAGTDALPAATFRPRPLDNLAIADELESLAPIIDAKVANYLGEDTPQIYTACGRGARSSVRILRQGLEVMEAVSSELPGAPIAVWTTKLKSDGTTFPSPLLVRPLTVFPQTNTTRTLSFPSSTVPSFSPLATPSRKSPTPASSRPLPPSASSNSAKTLFSRSTPAVSATSLPTSASTSGRSAEGTRSSARRPTRAKS